MEETGNIFEGIVVNERSYTELFQNMCRYKFFRDEFARFLKQQSEDNEEWESLSLSDFYFHSSEVETQYFAQESGTYPDLVISTPDVRLMIEVKTSTWTGLQGSQPRDYLTNLARTPTEAAHKGLFFLVPRYYSHEGELKKRISDEEVQKQVRKAGIKPLMILHWEDFIEQLLQAGAQELNSNLRDFIDLSNDWFINGKIALRSGELAAIKKHTLGSGLYMLRALVEIVRERFRRTERLKIGRTRWEDYDFGFYIDRADETIGYFGIDSYAWTRGFWPLVIGVKPDATGDIRGTEDLSRQEDEDGICYWGFPNNLLSKQNALEEVSARFASVFNVEPSGTGEAEDEVKFSHRELAALFDGQTSGGAYQKLLRLIEQIHTAAIGSNEQIRVKTAGSRWEHSLYISENGKPRAAFGIFFTNWKDEGGLPLWIGLPTRSSSKAFEELEKEKFIAGEGYPENGWSYKQLTLDDVSPEQDLVEYSLMVLKKMGLDTGLPT